MDHQAQDRQRKEEERFRENLQEQQSRNSNERDKHVLTLSSAGIALSISITKVFPAAVCKWILVSALVGFVFTIISTISSYFSNQKGNDYNDEYSGLLDQWEDLSPRSNERNTIHEQLENFYIKIRRWKKINRRLNNFSICLFVFSLVLLATFSSINILKEEKVSESKEQKVKSQQEASELVTESEEIRARKLPNKPNDTNKKNK